eukprot:scaffold33283_cov94-Skeletonema_marinoi.AAC.1
MTGGGEACDTGSLLALTLLLDFKRGVLSQMGSGGANGWSRGFREFDKTVQYLLLDWMCRPLEFVEAVSLRFADSALLICRSLLRFKICFEHLSAKDFESKTPSEKQELYISSKFALLEGSTSQL